MEIQSEGETECSFKDPVFQPSFDTLTNRNFHDVKLNHITSKLNDISFVLSDINTQLIDRIDEMERKFQKRFENIENSIFELKNQITENSEKLQKNRFPRIESQETKKTRCLLDISLVDPENDLIDGEVDCANEKIIAKIKRLKKRKGNKHNS
jgi:hypothetical protein